MTKPSYDMLGAVVAELKDRAGQIRRIAAETGISYDTVLRVKNEENNPSYNLVKRLHDHLFRKHARRVA